jgi:hypothetical protein
MSSLRTDARDCLEAWFCREWGATTPVKYWGTRRHPAVPYVEISATINSSRHGDEAAEVTGLFAVVLFFAPDEGMESALGLAGSVVRLLFQRTFTSKEIHVTFGDARITGSMERHGGLCSLKVSAPVAARDVSENP